MLLAGLGWLGAQGPTPDPRALGMAGAVTSIVEGIHVVGYNPARLAYSPADLSMNLGGITLGLVNNFLSVSNYNRFNGADFIDTTASEYEDKQKFLDDIPREGIRFKTSMHLPIPILNWARGTTAFSSEVVVFGDMGLPKALVLLLMEGNPIGQELDLALENEVIGVAEWGFSFYVPLENVAFGFTLKYLQGLFYLGVDPDTSFGYLRTEATGLQGEGRYLIRQAVGGSGLGLDLGFATREIDGFQMGISLINALGSIRWHGPSITKDIMGDFLQGFMPWRENEYYLYTYSIKDVTLERFQEASTDSIFQKKGITVVETETGLIPSDSLTNSQLKEINLRPFVTDYPALFRLGISKRFEGVGTASVDLTTGFQDRLWASRGWQLAVGVELFPTPSFPIRMGLRYGGRNQQQLGIGFGVHLGVIHFDAAMAFHNGLWLHTTKGLSLALGFTFVR